MRSFIPKVLLVILSGIASLSAVAQRHVNPKHYTEATNPWQRIHVGVSRPFLSIMMDYDYVGFDYYGRKNYDHYRQKMPQRNFGVVVGTFFPISKFDEKSKLCISADFLFHEYNWDVIKNGTVSYNSGTHMYQLSDLVVAGSRSVAFPVTLDYRSGCDAMQSKKFNSCFAIGAGLYPGFTETDYYDIEQVGRLFVRPVAKLEAGVRAGMCFKVRAMYQMGNIKYMDYQNNGAGFEERLTFESRGTFILSMLVIPTAFSWKDEL